MSYRIEKYQAQYKTQWDRFVETSKNGTFLFKRDFMEYHSDRFKDYSLMVFNGEKLLALLPANIQEHELFSHSGLTYGGLVLNPRLKTNAILKIFKDILHYLYDRNIERLSVKAIPSIYHKIPAEEINYLAFVGKAEMYRRDTLAVVDIKELQNISVSNDRKLGYKRAIKKELMVKEEQNFELFWNEILIPNMNQKHSVKPVHTLEEMTFLKKHFPKNIRQFNVYDHDKIVAGTTIFETDKVAHSQYISGNKNKNELGSLDFLHFHLLNTIFKEKKYFDFGISNEHGGWHINEGLQYWKEGFGARCIVQDFYKFTTSNYILLDKVLV